MAQRQFTTPLLIRGFKDSKTVGETVSLNRVPFVAKRFNESWLQELLFRHPLLLPVNDIEPVFTNAIPIVRELPTSAGPVDVLYINPRGFMTLVETKLWRNPEARRSVLAQIIDYAKSMALWSYMDLVKAVKAASPSSVKDPLISLMSEIEGEDFDEKSFVDQISQNLRKGRFLLLIVGDGIQEGVELMADFLQQTPQLGFTLGLVEIALFQEHPESNDPIFVQPRIIARTREVTRGIIEIKAPAKLSDVSVVLAPDEPPGKGARKPLTEQVFLESLHSEAGPDVRDLAKWVLDNAADHQLTVEFGSAGPVLRYDDDFAECFFNFGQLHYKGLLGSTNRLFDRFKELGLPLEICREYLDDVARLVPGASRRPVYATSKKMSSEAILFGENPGPEDWVPLAKLAPKRDDWFTAIDKAVGRIRDAFKHR